METIEKALIVFAVLLISLPSFGRVYAQEIAPDFALTDIDGNDFSIADFRGTTVVLTFVSTRVILCKMQVYILVNVSGYFEDDVVIALIGVSNDTVSIDGDADEQLREFSEDCGFEGIVAKDTEEVAEDYNVTYLPTTFIVDQGGYIRHKHVGVVQTGEDILLGELQVIIPEFSSTTILLSIMVLSTLTLLTRRRSHRKE